MTLGGLALGDTVGSAPAPAPAPAPAQPPVSLEPTLNLKGPRKWGAPAPAPAVPVPEPVPVLAAAAPVVAPTAVEANIAAYAAGTGLGTALAAEPEPPAALTEKQMLAQSLGVDLSAILTSAGFSQASPAATPARDGSNDAGVRLWRCVSDGQARRCAFRVAALRFAAIRFAAQPRLS